MGVNQDKRDRPYTSLIKVIDLLKNVDRKTIIEIGCMRGTINHPVHEFHHPCCNDGHSTAVFASYGMEVISVDICQSAVNYANDVLVKSSNKSSRAVCADGIEFLRGYKGKIDLLFLDAWDVGLLDSSEKHLEAYLIANPKLPVGSYILIDDTDVDFDGKEVVEAVTVPGGKGKLVVPKAIEDGYDMIFTGRQTLLRKTK